MLSVTSKPIPNRAGLNPLVFTSLKKPPNFCAVLIPARPPILDFPLPPKFEPPKNFAKLEVTLLKLLMEIVPVSHALVTLPLSCDQLG